MDQIPESPVLNKSVTNTVYIFNLSEDVWPFIDAWSDNTAQKREIEENADLGDRDLFSFCGEENMVFVLPRAVGKDFFDYFESIFGKKNFQILIPQTHSGVICNDILHDPAVMDALIHAANGQKRLNVKSYTTSQPFLDLVRTLRDRGLTIFTPDSPEEDDAWTVNFYGSKSGIRQFAQQNRVSEPDLIMADGVIVSGIIDASRIAANKYIRERGVVIKTNKGHAGAGVLILRDNDLPYDFVSCQQQILKLLQKDEYWKKFPIVIESYISINYAIGGGFPNVEFHILKNGHAEAILYGGMRMSRDGVYKGMEMNHEAVSDQLAARMVDTGFFIAEQYRASGYRGYFDVDFVAAKNGQIYVTESNVRRTGGTHVYAVAEHFFGKDFMYLTYIIAHNSYALPEEKHFTFSGLLTTLQPVLFTKEKREGLILISENLLRYNLLAYILFAPNKKRAYEIEATMESLLR